MKLALLIALLAGLIVLPVPLLGSTLDERFATDRLVHWLQDRQAWAWAAGMGLIVADLFLPIPATSIIAGLGIVYGPFWGGLAGAAGAWLAGMLAYGLCRAFGVSAARWLVGPEPLERLHGFFHRFGLVALALSRGMPLLPEVLSCLSGLARMGVRRVMLGLAIGSVPLGIGFAWLGYVYRDEPLQAGLISATIPLLVWPVVWLIMRRQPRPPTAASQPPTA